MHHANKLARLRFCYVAVPHGIRLGTALQVDDADLVTRLQVGAAIDAVKQVCVEDI